MPIKIPNKLPAAKVLAEVSALEGDSDLAKMIIENYLLLIEGKTLGALRRGKGARRKR